MGFDLKTRGRAWIAVIQTANMTAMGLDEETYSNPEILAAFLSNLWKESGKGRTCAVAVCVSEQGLYHAHMALYGNTTTLQNVANILYKSHVEPQLGGKTALKDYLLKQGSYAEKGEKILCIKDIDAVQDVQGKRSDLEAIEEMLLKGFTPQQILDSNFRFYKYEKMILHSYIDMKIAEAPVRRELLTIYHFGASGSGKTFTYNQLCEKFGADRIYLLTDYDNNASGGLDSYMKVGAPPILFMDEFKGFGISYGKLLTMLSGYSRMQTHSRYANTFNLWEQVHITSVYPLEHLYENMVDSRYQDTDSYRQLLRRITKIVFHYIENGEYKTFEMDGKDYQGCGDLQYRAFHQEFTPLTEVEQMELPFKE